MTAAIIWNVRQSIADQLARRNQPADTRLAMRWMPANAAYITQLADEVYASDPASARLLLEKAVALNRYDAASWIQLGLLREAAGDVPQAEAALLRAADADTTFLPSWSLANFYFRRERVPAFWHWAQRAAHMDPDDATPLFRLAWYISPDARELESRLQLDRPGMQGQFVNFVIREGDVAAVSTAALQLASQNDRDSVDTLLGACDWLIANKHADTAMPIWNALVEHRELPFPSLTAGTPYAVTNGTFDQAPLGHGFDWRPSTVVGVSSFLNAHPNELGFEFSGEQPESFLLLRETAPVTARKAYSLLVDYRTESIPPGSGMVWSVTDEQSGTVLAKTSSLSADQGGTAATCFTVPQGAQFVDLSLIYQRQAGTVRVAGKLALKQVRLAPFDGRLCS